MRDWQIQWLHFLGTLENRFSFSLASRFEIGVDIKLVREGRGLYNILTQSPKALWMEKKERKKFQKIQYQKPSIFCVCSDFSQTRGFEVTLDGGIGTIDCWYPSKPQLIPATTSIFTVG
jgi:hypothetical protein